MPRPPLDVYVAGEHWDADCTHHPGFVVDDKRRHCLEGVYEEAKNHVDRS